MRQPSPQPSGGGGHRTEGVIKIMRLPLEGVYVQAPVGALLLLNRGTSVK
jgi:hypothetical protein